MTVEVQEVLDVLEEIKLMITDIDSILVISGAQVSVSEGLSDISDGLGLISAGEFRTGKGTPGRGFSGMRMAYPALTYDSEDWNLVGIDNDTLQVGIRSSDGKLLAGAGAVILDAAGITATAGTIGGWVLGSDSIKDAGGVVGMLSTVTGGDDIRFFAGHATPASAPFYVTEAGALVASSATITGTITATTGIIGGFTVGATTLSAGTTHIVLDSSNKAIYFNDITFGNAGIQIEYGAGSPRMYLGDGSSIYMEWSGGVLTVNGGVITGLASGSELAIQGWQFDGVFSATDLNTVAWTLGTLTFQSGDAFSIVAGNTGNMAATTYIYFDKATSETVLQTSTTAGDAVGVNRVLICVAKNSTNDALFQVFGGAGGILVGTSSLEDALITTAKIVDAAVEEAKVATDAITSAKILANTIVAGDIAANTITAAEIAVGTITATEIAADTITANEIAAVTITAAEIAANVITANEIAANTITASEIAASAIETDELAANAVTAAKIAANTITAGQIAAGTITATEMNVSQLSAISADMGTITAGSITITNTADKIYLQSDGDAFFGSNVAAAATTALAIFANAQTYNSESVGAGDLLIGDNTASKANILWDASAGTLLFRGGTTTQGYIDTDGVAIFGGGTIQLDQFGVTIQTGQARANTINWRDVSGADGTNYGALYAYKLGSDPDFYGTLVLRAGADAGGAGSGTAKLQAYNASLGRTGSLDVAGNESLTYTAQSTTVDNSIQMFTLYRILPGATNAADGFGFRLGFALDDDTSTMQWAGMIETKWTDVSDNAGAMIFYYPSSTVEFLRLGYPTGATKAAVFNEGGLDMDFRVESDGNANMFFVDGGADRVGVGGIPDTMFHVMGSENILLDRTDGTGITLILRSTEDTEWTSAGTLSFVGHNDAAQDVIYAYMSGLITDNTDGTEDGRMNFVLMKDGAQSTFLIMSGGGPSNASMSYYSAQAADNDAVAVQYFYGKNDAAQNVVYCYTGTWITDNTDGTEDGRWGVYPMVAGTSRQAFVVKSNEVVVNDDSNDIDFRAESNANANMLFVDAGNSRIGFGVLPSYFIHGQDDTADVQVRFESTEDMHLVIAGDRSNDDEARHAWASFYQDGGVRWMKIGVGEAGNNNEGFISSFEGMRFFVDAGTFPPANQHERLFLGTTSVVVNEGSQDVDFRVESDGYANMFKISGAGSYVGIGTATANAIAYFSNTGIVFNEDSQDRDFRVEGVNGTHVLFVDGGQDRLEFSRYLPAGTFNTPQSSTVLTLRKGLATVQDGTGPKMALRVEDDSAVEHWAGGFSMAYDFTNDLSDLIFQVRSGVGDTYATTEVLRSNSTYMRVATPILIKELAAAIADQAGYGQLWVKNTTPCELWFTDDAGTDTQIV